VYATLSGLATSPIKGIIWRRRTSLAGMEEFIVTERSKPLLIVAAFLLVCGSAAPLWAQDAGSEVVPLPELAPQDPMVDSVGPVQPPVDPQFEWTDSRTNTNTAGNVSNTHQRYTSDDGNTYIRQHLVTNPSGQLTHTWERTNDGDSHTMSREKNRVFGDGRTMDMTRTYSWDAESGTGTSSRSFLGPNGQVRDFERPWSPDGELAHRQPSLAPGGPRTLDTPQPTERGLRNFWGFFGSAKKPKPKSSFWSRLDWSRRGHESMAGRKPSPRRSGFTLGSTTRHGISAPRYGLAKKQAGQAQVKTRGPRPSRPPQAASRPHPVRTH
jgi:hypothetical protein